MPKDKTIAKLITNLLTTRSIYDMWVVTNRGRKLTKTCILFLLALISQRSKKVPYFTRKETDDW